MLLVGRDLVLATLGGEIRVIVCGVSVIRLVDIVVVVLGALVASVGFVILAEALGIVFGLGGFIAFGFFALRGLTLLGGLVIVLVVFILFGVGQIV